MKRPSVVKSSVFNQNTRKKMLSPTSPFAVKETYGGIRTQLMFMRKNEKCQVLAVTSVEAGDGKSLNCVNIAISFANLGKRVLIIDADMRNPTIHKLFSLSCANGLSELLAGFSDSVGFKAAPVENITVLTAGETPPNPAELLASKRMGEFLRSAGEHFDYIIIDTPPIGLVTDATVLADRVDGFIMMVCPGRTDINDLKTGVTKLQTLGGSIIGFIINDVDGVIKSHRAFGNNRYPEYEYHSRFKDSLSNIKKKVSKE